MRTLLMTVSALLVSVALAASTSPSNLLANPRFDKGIEGWSKNPLSHLDLTWVPEDEAGVVHSGRDLRTGEAWERGPLVISLGDVHAQSDWEGYNVVIHECAHKLDMRNGASDGFPPLHRGMSARDWTAAFMQAWEDLRGRIGRDEETPIDDYAAESPAECFAVFSEYFFESPHILRVVYPAVYEQLAQFYRQDPAVRRIEGV